jgi:hypothetical protein
MPNRNKVACHLCGDLFDVEESTATKTDDCTEIPTLYYCRRCSEQKLDLTCSNCGKIFQRLPVREERPDIRHLCEECSDAILDEFVLTQKELRIRQQK